MQEFQQTMGAGALISIAVGAVILLLLLIIRFRVHAFVALIIVSLLTALATGIPAGNILTTITSAFGSTLGGWRCWSALAQCWADCSKYPAARRRLPTISSGGSEKSEPPWRLVSHR